jgi:hypothetical protein
MAAKSSGFPPPASWKSPDVYCVVWKEQAERVSEDEYGMDDNEMNRAASVSPVPLRA